MFEKFKWSPAVVLWLVAVVIVCSVISYNMPEYPRSNETVLLPGYQFIEVAIYAIGISIVISVLRKRTILINFEANWLEAFVALNGAALFLSPFVALLVKFVVLVATNDHT
ncbi:MAG: hypothetical protein P8103_17175 [Candidatus Thiodiazotropha sp.]